MEAPVHRYTGTVLPVVHRDNRPQTVRIGTPQVQISLTILSNPKEDIIEGPLILKSTIKDFLSRRWHALWPRMLLLQSCY